MSKNLRWTAEQAESELAPDVCHECERDTIGELTWPGEGGHEICQDCWEAEGSRSWWQMVKRLDTSA
jgi:hypothetical protein